MAGKIEIAMEKVEEIKKAAVNFKDSIAGNLKDMNVEMKDWRFGMESNEQGITIDVTVKVLIKPKSK
jgi:uncharacterized alkaline shock family protein YloU